MPFHRVQQGECLSTIADLYRIGTWQSLHDHPNNAALKKARPNPGVLLPGDQVFVPEREEKDAKLVARPTGQVHEFKLSARMARLLVVLKDADDKPFEGKKFIVTVGDRDIPGETGDDGLVEVVIPVTARRATLRAWLYDDDDPDDPDIDHDLLLGHLDPPNTISGIQARLQNLGFRVTVDGVMGRETLRAIEHFRAKYGVVRKGKEPIDDALCEALQKQHEGT